LKEDDELENAQNEVEWLEEPYLHMQTHQHTHPTASLITDFLLQI